MYSQNSYETSVVRVIKSLTPDATYILSGRNASEPKPPFAYINMISSTAEGRNNIDTKVYEINGGYYERVNQTYRLEFSVTYHGESTSDSERLCRHVELGLNSSYFERMCHENGLGFMKSDTTSRLIEDVNKITNFLNDTISLTFTTRAEGYYPVDYFDGVDVVSGIEIEVDKPNPDEPCWLFDKRGDVLYDNYGKVLTEDGFEIRESLPDRIIKIR